MSRVVTKMLPLIFIVAAYILKAWLYADLLEPVPSRWLSYTLALRRLRVALDPALRSCYAFPISKYQLHNRKCIMGQA
jgi:hypothetical protein